MKRRVSIVKLIIYRSESGARLRPVDTTAQGCYYVYRALRKLYYVYVAPREIVNGGFLECHIERVLVDKLPADDWKADVRPPPDDIVVYRDVLPQGLTPQLAGALAWAGFGNCNCFSRRERNPLQVLRGGWTQEEIDAVIHL
jgi:hypothetical protein